MAYFIFDVKETDGDSGATGGIETTIRDRSGH